MNGMATSESGLRQVIPPKGQLPAYEERERLGLTLDSKYRFGSSLPWRLIRTSLENNSYLGLKFLGDSTFFSTSGIPVELRAWIAANYANAFVLYHVLNTAGTGLDQTVVNDPIPANRMGWKWNVTAPGKFMTKTNNELIAPSGKAALRFEAVISLPSSLLTSGKPNQNIVLVGVGPSGVPSYLVLDTNGKLWVLWRANGGVFVSNTGVSSAAVAGGTMLANTFYGLAVDIIFDNGAAAREVRYYTSVSSSLEVARKAATWVQLGTTMGGAASTFELPADYSYWIGTPGGGNNPAVGVKIHEAQVLCSATNGGARLPAIPNRIDMFAKIAGDTPDSKLEGGGYVVIDNLSRNGTCFLPSGFNAASYWNLTGASNFVDNIATIVFDRQDAIIFYTDGHNARGNTLAGAMTYPVLKSGMDTLRTNVNARFANPPQWINVTQNPQHTSSYNNEWHLDLQNWHMEYAMRNDFPVLNLTQIPYDLVAPSRNIDAYTDGGVHPSSVLYTLQFNEVVKSIKVGTNYVL